MVRVIEVPIPARIFESAGGNRLARKGKTLPRGSRIAVVETEVMVYDHREQLALRFLDEEGQPNWILVIESGVVLNA